MRDSNCRWTLLKAYEYAFPIVILTDVSFPEAASWHSSSPSSRMPCDGNLGTGA